MDNSAASTTDFGNNLDEATKYACEDTKDKIFLLSMKEATSYGFPTYNRYGVGNARIRKPTDYAKANHALWTSTDGYGGDWWSRSPYSDTSIDTSIHVRYVRYDGKASAPNMVDDTSNGVVPALCLDLK